MSKSLTSSPQLKPPRQTLPRADDLQSMCCFPEEVPLTEQIHRLRLALDMFQSFSMCTPACPHPPSANYTPPKCSPPVGAQLLPACCLYVFSPLWWPHALLICCQNSLHLAHPTMHTGFSIHVHSIGEGWQCILPRTSVQSRGYLRTALSPLPQSWPEQGSHNPGEHDNIQGQI